MLLINKSYRPVTVPHPKQIVLTYIWDIMLHGVSYKTKSQEKLITLLLIYLIISRKALFNKGNNFQHVFRVKNKQCVLRKLDNVSRNIFQTITLYFMQYILKAYSVKTIGHVNTNMQKTLKKFFTHIHNVSSKVHYQCLPVQCLLWCYPTNITGLMATTFSVWKNGVEHLSL